VLHELGRTRVADIDHVAVLQNKAASADRHHLQLMAALFAEPEHAEHAHILRVAVAVEIVEASLVRMRMLVGKAPADSAVNASAATPARTRMVRLRVIMEFPL